MEHIQTVLEIAKPLADLSKKLYEVTKSLKDHDAERRVDEILDELRDLKQSASRLGLTQTERFAQSVMQSRSLGRWESQDKAAVLTFVNALSVTTGSK